MTKIMIADDNVETTKHLSYILSRESDFEVINVSHNGLDTIKYYKELQPDVLLLDLNMPSLSGLEVLDIIPEYDKSRNIIIISGSAYFRSKLCNIDKIKTIYQKPYDINCIKNTIREIKNINITNTIQLKLDNIFYELQFDPFSKGTKLLKSAILISYQYPYLKLDDIMEKVKIQNNEKNAKTVHSIIDKQLDSLYSIKRNLDIFCKRFPYFYGFKPTTSRFIKYILSCL